jgi:hypothetical protein
VYTNAPLVRVRVNGGPPVAAPVAVGAYGSAVLTGVPFAAGNITAECGAAVGGGDDAATAGGAATTLYTVLASHTKHSWGAPAALLLSLDAPSARTGTGGAVYLDGEDVALVRAAVVDAEGVVVHDSSLVVSFAVAGRGESTGGGGGGPALARIAGVGNGDPANRVPLNASRVPAYHGLARAVARVTARAVGSAAARALEAMVNADAGKGPLSSRIVLGDVAGGGGGGEGGSGSGSGGLGSFTVTATAGQLPSASLQVALSTDPRDSVLSVAAASVHLADVGGVD